MEGGSAVSFATDAFLGKPREQLATLFEAQTGHLTDRDCEFLRLWDRLLHAEQKASVTRQPEIWNLAGPERERRGRCIADLALTSAGEDGKRLVFTRPETLNASFSVGELLILSVQGAWC